MAKKGAQNGDFLHVPDVEMLRRLQAAAQGCVKLVTVAPEEPNGIEFVRQAASDGITVSLGHTTAGYDIAKAAYDAGATHTTHLYNGMPSLHHREPSVIGAASDSPNAKVEIICDGIHVHESAVRLTFRLFGKERVVLISDSLRATGMPDGIYPFGGQEIEVHGNRATIAGHPETLAGSVTSLMGCVRQAVKYGIPLEDAVRAASYNPAQAIKIDDRAGSLEIGKEASVILLDQETLEIREILFKGARVER
jgi:N-acetylglucosamine-6-phosphate deacetylase